MYLVVVLDLLSTTMPLEVIHVMFYSYRFSILSSDMV